MAWSIDACVSQTISDGVMAKSHAGYRLEHWIDRWSIRFSIGIA